MARVPGGVRHASAKLLSFLDERHPDRSRRLARKVNGGERSGKTCPDHGNVTVRIPVRGTPALHRWSITGSGSGGKSRSI
jgi:hypothetical protein